MVFLHKLKIRNRTSFILLYNILYYLYTYNMAVSRWHFSYKSNFVKLMSGKNRRYLLEMQIIFRASEMFNDNLMTVDDKNDSQRNRNLWMLILIRNIKKEKLYYTRYIMSI